MNPQWNDVDRYFAETLVGDDPALQAAARASRAAGLPDIAVAPNQGKFLMLLARMAGARRILEVGTLGGYSTIWLARGLAKGGRVITIEADSRHAEVARANIAAAGLADTVAVKRGAAADVLAEISATEKEPFDLVFIDADKPNNPLYFDWAVKLSHKGAIIVVDNVVRDGRIADAANADPGVAGTRAMFERISKDRRVSATAIQTVGIKGYDGFLVAVVN